MRRRELLSFIGAVTWPAFGNAQPRDLRPQFPERVRRVGVLLTYAENDPEALSRKLLYQRTLRDLGWIEGTNLELRFGWTGGNPDRAADLVRDILAWQPDVVVGSSAAITLGLVRHTSSIPIVFLNLSDPVGMGIVKSLSHPGGNVTGFAHLLTELPSKCLSLLKQAAPAISVATVLYNAKTIGHRQYEGAFDGPAATLGLKVLTSNFVSDEQLDRAIRRAAEDQNGSLIVVPDGFTLMRRDRIIAAAAEHRLPAIYGWAFYPRAGGLMSYGIAEILNQHRSAAEYVNLILRGAKPSDLPVQQPTKYELVINTRTAKALGLEIPASLLAIADEVIE